MGPAFQPAARCAGGADRGSGLRLRDVDRSQRLALQSTAPARRLDGSQLGERDEDPLVRPPLEGLLRRRRLRTPGRPVPLRHGGEAEAAIDFGTGQRREIPFLADWDGDGRDDPCLYRGRTFSCDTDHDGGLAEAAGLKSSRPGGQGSGSDNDEVRLRSPRSC